MNALQDGGNTPTKMPRKWENSTKRGKVGMSASMAGKLQGAAVNSIVATTAFTYGSP